MIGLHAGWFNSFDINNWHGSLRKVKNCNKEERGKKRFIGLLSGRKERAFFGIRYCEKCTGKSNVGKEKQEGLTAKINANNLCQRKLF
jgi:hypothetical protein